MNQMLGFQAFKVRTPLLLHAIASKARDRDDLVRIALDLRVSRPARRFREYCTSIDEAIAAGDLTGMEGAITELSKIGIRLSDVVSGESTSDQRLNGFLEIAHSAPPLARSLAVLMRVPLLSMERWFRRRRFTLLDELASAPRWESPVEHELLASWTR
jgi:hypothetical protein